MDKAIGGREVLDLAIKAEEKGAELYKTLSKKSKNYHVSQVFGRLADEECKHIKALKRWGNRVVPYKAVEAYPGEYILYIKAMAEENTFKCNKACERFLETDISEEDAVQACITFEKDFILYLHSLKRHIKKGEEKIINSIIDSEESHLKQLYTLKKKINL